MKKSAGASAPADDRTDLQLPAVVIPRLGGRHGEIAVIGEGSAVSPGGINVILGAVQNRHGPDVGVIGQRGALDALQL